jgi:hypothetical protein
MAIKPMVKTGRSEVKFPISLTRDLGYSARSEHEVDVGGSGREDVADAECLYCASLITEDHDGENGLDANNV